MTNVVGLPRAYFNQRLAAGMRQLIHGAQSWGYTNNDTLEYIYVLPPSTVKEDPVEGDIRVINIQDVLDRLIDCPVCGLSLNKYDGEELYRSCEAGCGRFSVAEVRTDRSVVLQMEMPPWRVS